MRLSAFVSSANRCAHELSILTSPTSSLEQDDAVAISIESLADFYRQTQILALVNAERGHSQNGNVAIVGSNDNSALSDANNNPEVENETEADKDIGGSEVHVVTLSGDIVIPHLKLSTINEDVLDDWRYRSPKFNRSRPDLNVSTASDSRPPISPRSPGQLGARSPRFWLLHSRSPRSMHRRFNERGGQFTEHIAVSPLGASNHLIHHRNNPVNSSDSSFLRSSFIPVPLDHRQAATIDRLHRPGTPSHRELKDYEALLASHSISAPLHTEVNSEESQPWTFQSSLNSIHWPQAAGIEDYKPNFRKNISGPENFQFNVEEGFFPKQTHRTISLPSNHITATNNLVASKKFYNRNEATGRVSPPYEEDWSKFVGTLDGQQDANVHNLRQKNPRLTRVHTAKELLALLARDFSDEDDSDGTLLTQDNFPEEEEEEQVIEETMPRTTDEWRSSFSSMRDRFRPVEDMGHSDFEKEFIFSTNGSLTLPRKGMSGVMKSASYQDMTVGKSNFLPHNQSLLSNAVERRAVEAPDLDRPYSPNRTMGNFWLETIRNRPTSPIQSRAPQTAAQRLELLHESMDEIRSRRNFSGNLASRRSQYLSDAVTNRHERPRPVTPYSSLRMTSPFEAASSSRPNFSSLDNAVSELGHNQEKVNGCGRFPTLETATSPIGRKSKMALSSQHSPSPDTVSEASSTMSTPAGLPHPRPKHNLREQMIHVGIEPRSAQRVGVGLYPRPGLTFPTPSSGSVALRVSELEKRPGTPQLHIAGANTLGGYASETPRSPLGPLSPKTTTYRTKPIIHLEMRDEYTENSHESRNADKFDFSKPYFDSPIVANHVSTQPSTNIISPQATTTSPVTKLADNFNRIKLDSPSHRTPNRKPSQTTRPEPFRWAQPSLSYKSRQIVPRFFFPQGKPVSSQENEASLRRVTAVFANLPGGKASMREMGDICRAAGLSFYWKRPVFDACLKNGQCRPLVLQDFVQYWTRMTTIAHDEAARFVYTLAPSRSYIEKNDLEPFLLDLIESFPGLHFLREAPEFHSRYVQTVIVRIFWSVNRSWSGRITAAELRKSSFLQTVRKLEETEDINKINDFFSYEHFYVIYCKFWELDKDHNLSIDRIDMAQHANGALTPRIIERIFSGAVTRGRNVHRTTALASISYPEFVSFLLAEEDKKHPTSIEYWFRCLDLDGDGVLSLFEMEYFYSDIQRKMESYGIDTMKFEDVACNLLDMVDPKIPNQVTLADLKKCSLSTRFLNAFVNWNKYYEQEATDGERATVKSDEDEEISDWDRFCAEEYELLMADEQGDTDDADINLNLDDDEDGGVDDNASLTLITAGSREMNGLRRSPVLDAL